MSRLAIHAFPRISMQGEIVYSITLKGRYAIGEGGNCLQFGLGKNNLQARVGVLIQLFNFVVELTLDSLLNDLF